MTVTPFGWIFVAALACVLVLRPFWLAALVVVSAVLHAPVVVVISGASWRFGVTPWLVASIGVIMVLGASLFRAKPRVGTLAVFAQPMFLAWSLFFAWSISSVMFLPFVFAGLDTYNVASTESLATGPEPLEWRAVYAVHAANFALIWALFGGVQWFAGSSAFRSSLYAGVILAATLSVALSLGQRALVAAGVGQPEALLASLNPAYVQTPFQQYGSFFRVGLPFSEPSYASSWFAAMFGAGLGAFLFTRSVLLGCGLVVGAGLGLLNALGGSGLAGACLAGTVLLASAVFIWWRSRVWRPLLGPKLAVIGVSISLVAVVITVAALREQCGTWCPSQFYAEIVEPRLADYEREGLSRHRSNLHALHVVAETSGLGVGLGANRASSNLLSMASTIGVLPTLLFYAMLSHQLLRARALGAPKKEQVIYGCGLLAMMCSVVVGIPDLAWPAMWIWVLASFSLVAAPGGRRSGSEAGSSRR